MYNTTTQKTGITVSASAVLSSTNSINPNITNKIRLARAKHKSTLSNKSNQNLSWKQKNLKQKAIKFQQGLVSRREIIDDLSSMILYVPKAMKCVDYDVRYDFYLEIISHIDTIIKCYIPDDNFTFETWFIQLLKKRFISFMRSQKLKAIHVEDNVIVDLFDYEENEDVVNYNSIYSIFDDLDFSHLTDKEIELLNAKYGFISIDQNETPIAKEFFDIEAKHSNLQKRIAKKYTTLLDIQFQISNETDQEKLQILKEREQQVINTKRKLEHRLKSMKSNVTIRSIAKYYNLSKNTVSKYIKQAERKVYKRNITNF